MLLDATEDELELSPDRAWWLRVPATLVSPRPVFFALRDDDPDDVAARSEPVLLLVLLAGMAAVLASPTAGGLLDKSDYDAALVAVWTFVAGGIYGAVGYFLTGFALFFGALDHADGGAILDASTRIEILQLREYIRRTVRHDLSQM